MLIATTRRVERADPSGAGRKIWPKGWSGNLPDDLAQELIDAGDATSLDRGSPASKSLADMTKAELEAEAERRGLDISGAKTKADLVDLMKD